MGRWRRRPEKQHETKKQNRSPQIRCTKNLNHQNYSHLTFPSSISHGLYVPPTGYTCPAATRRGGEEIKEQHNSMIQENKKRSPNSWEYELRSTPTGMLCLKPRTDPSSAGKAPFPPTERCRWFPNPHRKRRERRSNAEQTAVILRYLVCDLRPRAF